MPRRPLSQRRTRLFTTSDSSVVEIGVADGLRRLEREAPPEHARASGRAPARPARAGRSSTRSSRAASAAWPAHRASATSSSGSRRSSRASSSSGSRSATRAAASSIASGSPSSRRQISPTAAVGRKPGAIARARSTNSDRGIVVRQRLDRVPLLRVDVQRLAARDEHLRVRRPGEERRDRRRGLDDLLEVVEQDEQPLVRRRARSGRRRHRREAPIARSTSAGSRSACSGTQKTPSGNCSTASAASWSARRVLPLPPGPVSVSRRCDAQRARPPPRARAPVRRAASAGSAGSSDRASSAAETRSSPSWKRRCGRVRSLSRCSPRSRSSPSASSSCRVVSEITTWPPWPAPMIARRPVDVEADVTLVRDDRLAGVDADPHAHRSAVERGLAVCEPRRPHRVARAKATKNASPCVSTSTPPCRANASRSTPAVLREHVRVARRRARAAGASSPRCR